MRKSRYWLLIGLVLLGLAGSLWLLVRERPPKASAQKEVAAFLRPPVIEPVKELGPHNYAQNLPLLSVATNQAAAEQTNAAKLSHNIPLLAYRLTNTAKPLKELMHSDSALLLRNALIDTTQPALPTIPPELKS